MAQIFPIDFEEKLTMAQDDYILFSDSEDGNKIKKAQYKNLKGEKGDPGDTGSTGPAGARINSASFSGDDIVFGETDGNTVILAGAKTTLTGPQGNPGTPGADGNDGAAATITVGSTTTGTPGSSASVTNSGTTSAAVLDFTIPQGAKGEPGEDGDDGAAATITVGTTTTLPAGSSATVTNVGTSQDAILNFGIPKGDSGTGSGDVNGPASSTDGHLAVFDGATGKIIKDGGEIPENTKIFGFPNVNSDISSIITATASNKNVILSESLSMTEVRFYRVIAKKPESNRIVATSYKQSTSQYIVKTINYNSSKIVTSITETVKSFFDSSTVLTKTNTTAFTPTGDYQPATKKYVDDKITTSATAPSSPTEGMLWYDTTSDELKVYDGSNWTGVGGRDVQVSTQANNIFTPGMKIWGGTESDYQSLTPDSNTAYLLLAGGPTPPSPWQPGVNTIAYYEFDGNLNDSVNSNNLSLLAGAVTYGTASGGGKYVYFGNSAWSEHKILSPNIDVSAVTIMYRWNPQQVYTSGNPITIACTLSDNSLIGATVRSVDFWATTGFTATADTWYHIAIVCEGGIRKFYIDGVYYTQDSYSLTGTQTTKLTINNAWDTNNPSFANDNYISKLIIEDKSRTAQEIQDYFDQTKANYGIS